MNKLIELALRNTLLVLALGLAVVAAGIYSFGQLPINAFPDTSPTLVQVFTVTEGLAPEEVEQYVTYPVEVAMNGLPNLEQIRSTSNFGLSVVSVYFEDGTDIYFARQLISERLQEAREEIPDRFGDPQMGPITTGTGLILFYYLEDSSGEYSLVELRTMQDWIVKRSLATVPGVTEVLGIGGYEKQYQVIVDPDALLQYDVTIAELIDRIQANNLNVGAQFIEQNGEQLIVRSVGMANSIDDLRNIVIQSTDGAPVYLAQLARIKVGGATRQGLQTRNGQHEVVAGMVAKLYGANSSTVISRLEKQIAEVNKSLPDGVRVVPYYQQKKLVQSAVGTVRNAILEGIVLVVLVLALFLGSVRPSVVVALAIPFSVLFAAFWMKRLGIPADLMSLGGLAIAIGMMVDGAIVTVENVDRLLRQAPPNEPRLRVVARACIDVVRPVAFGILIIVMVFLPLFTLGGAAGKMFRPLAYTIALAMFGSLLYAVFLAPVLSQLLMRRPPESEKQAPEPLGERAMERIRRWYRPIVAYFVLRRSRAVALAAMLALAGIAAFPFLGSEYIPQLQEGSLVLRLSMAPSISLEQSKQTTLRVERQVMKFPEVTGVVSRVGRGEVGAHTDPINSAEMFVSLKDEDQWRFDSQPELVAALREHLGEIPGALTNFTQPIQMSVQELLTGAKAELVVKVFGNDLAALKQNADRIGAILAKLEGAEDVQVAQVTGTPQLRIQVNRQALARHGINVADLQHTVQAAIGGSQAGKVFQGVRRFPIYVRFEEAARSTPDDIRNLLIPAPGGLRVPLAELALVEKMVGPRQITRENNQRFITVQLNVAGRDMGGYVAEARRAIDSAVDLPSGYFITWGGQYRLQQEANKRLMVVVPIALGLIFLLLYASFGSLKNASLILLNIPIALVGGILALAVSGQDLSVPASVGFIALFGVALLNGMVLVTCLNQLVAEGHPLDRASIEGAVLRLRPVLMTALAASLGLIPLLFATGTGSEVQRPLATVVVGGLVTSTLLTLLVLPALYKWFAEPVPQASGT